MRIAIVGAGISGLTAAYDLHRDHDVTVWEGADYVGGHTNTVEVTDGGEPLAIDTGGSRSGCVRRESCSCTCFVTGRFLTLSRRRER